MKAFLNWSGGKDSAFCLYQAQQQGIPIEALVTTINSLTDRIPMHGVPRSLLQQQASSAGLPLYMIEAPPTPNMKEYETLIRFSNQQLKKKGFTHVVSGDLFLEDLRNYRDALYGSDDLQTLYPLWKIDTKDLMHSFLAEGFRAIVVSINTAFLNQSFCGRLLDSTFIDDLPGDADVCGENGEFHSFVFDGPIFRKPIEFQKGKIFYQDFPSPRKEDSENPPGPPSVTGFYFCDLLPG